MTHIDHFAGLDDHPLDGGPRPELPKAKPAETVKHLCEHCGGDGKWRPRGGVARGKCHACKGKGYFLTSAEHRRKTRGQVIANKAKKLADSQAVFDEQFPGLVKSLIGMVEWNDFAKSLVEQFGKRGALSAPQIAAAERMIAKTFATRALRVAKSTTEATKVDLGTIRAMFEKAFEGGRKPPQYRAEGLTISRAPDHGRNAGCLYVKFNNDVYVGKITAENIFYEVNAGFESAGTPTVAKRLQTIAADPRDAAVRHGREFKHCSCCGRELTHPDSIEAGIGPICAANFGL